MATCKDCVHYDVCKIIHFPSIFGLTGDGCDHFKNKANVIEVPCKVGDTVYYIAGNKVYKSKCHAITLQPSLQIHLYDYDGDNARYSTKDVYRTYEEATQALKARANK